DLKAILVEREDCDAGTVTRVREALSQGATQYKTLRDVADVLRKRLETAAAGQAKKWHLKLGVALFFLGHTSEAVEHLKHAEGALASFTLGRALVSLGQLDEALKAFEKAEKSGYNASQVQLQRAGIFRQQSHLDKAEEVLNKLKDLSSHSA